MNAQQKKVLGCLTEFYELTKDDYTCLSIKDHVYKHKTNGYLVNIISSNFVDRKHNRRNSYLYKWKTIKPNLKMVDKCIYECRENSRSYFKGNEYKLVKGDSAPRFAFLSMLIEELSGDFKKVGLQRLAKKYGTNYSFIRYLIKNNYILIKDLNATYNSYQYKWNNKKSDSELRRVILEADANLIEGKEPIKKLETKVVEPKQENTTQIQVYENIIRTLNNDLDSKEKQIEELGKKLSLKTKRITKKVEPTQKNITILWGLIKIKY